MLRLRFEIGGFGQRSQIQLLTNGRGYSESVGIALAGWGPFQNFGSILATLACSCGPSICGFRELLAARHLP